LGIGTHSTVQVGEQKYDVETETRAGEHPVIDTTIYLSGRVLYRRVKACEDLSINTPMGPDTLHDRVEKQHHSVMEDLRIGVLNFEQKGLAPKLNVPPAPIEFPKGIEVRLVNAGSWLEAGNASLVVEVRGRATHKPAAGVGVEVLLEGALQPMRVQAGTDPRGRVSLTFPMPKLGVDGGELVIRAGGAAGRDELRYRLKPKARETRKSQAK
jgi:hypothetical protein